MSTARDDGGLEPAFPIQSEEDRRGDILINSNSGMSLHDYYVGQALMGAMVNASWLGDIPLAQRATQFAGLAGILHELADAVIAARPK